MACLVEKTSHCLLAEVRDFASNCIEAIHWNAGQMQTEFRETVCDSKWIQCRSPLNSVVVLEIGLGLETTF